jgi:hypothetical protein
MSPVIQSNLGFSKLFHILDHSLVTEAVQWRALFCNPILDSPSSSKYWVIPWLWKLCSDKPFSAIQPWILLALPCTGSFPDYGSCAVMSPILQSSLLDSLSSSIYEVTPCLWSRLWWALLYSPILDSHSSSINWIIPWLWKLCTVQ